jgi:hypothetical protein
LRLTICSAILCKQYITGFRIAILRFLSSFVSQIHLRGQPRYQVLLPNRKASSYPSLFGPGPGAESTGLAGGEGPLKGKCQDRFIQGREAGQRSLHGTTQKLVTKEVQEKDWSHKMQMTSTRREEKHQRTSRSTNSASAILSKSQHGPSKHGPQDGNSDTQNSNDEIYFPIRGEAARYNI